MSKSILPLQLLVAPSKDDPSVLVLYHGRGCPDGFGAALAAWLYGEQAEYVGLDHGDVSNRGRLAPAARTHGGTSSTSLSLPRSWPPSTSARPSSSC